MRRIGTVWAVLAIIGFLLFIAFCSAVAGYRSGLAKNASLAATEMAADLARQYELGLRDLAERRLLTAAERFRYILSRDPAYPGAAAKLAEAESRLSQTPVAPDAAPATQPRAAPGELLAQARAALDAADWDGAVSLLAQLQVGYPDYEAAQVKDALRAAYQSRGVVRIGAFRLQEGIFDLDQAETFGELDRQAAAQRTWATLYVRGNALWGANWPAAIAIFQDLYRAAPYFHDTAAKLHGAYLGYGDQLWARGDPCSATEQYANANGILVDTAVEAKRLAAEAACAAVTPTPGEGTPSATPEGTPGPETQMPTAPAEPSQTPTP